MSVLIMARKHQIGFSLIELSVVLLVLGILLKSTLPALINMTQINVIKQEATQLQRIKQRLLDFALIHQRLPCPSTDNSHGTEALTQHGCEVQTGWVPSVTLSIEGKLDTSLRMVNQWGHPLVYALALIEGDAVLQDQAVLKGIQTEWSTAKSSIAVDTGVNSACFPNYLRAKNVYALILSSGAKHYSSKSENENNDLDSHFVDSPRNNRAGCEHDDQIRWLSKSEVIVAINKIND